MPHFMLNLQSKNKSSVENAYLLQPANLNAQDFVTASFVCEADDMKGAAQKVAEHYGSDRVVDHGVSWRNGWHRLTIYEHSRYDDALLVKKALDGTEPVIFSGGIAALTQVLSGIAAETERAVYYYCGAVAYTSNNHQFLVKMDPKLVQRAIEQAARKKASGAPAKRCPTFYAMPREFELRRLLTGMYETVMELVGGQDFVNNCIDSRYSVCVYVSQSKILDAIPFIFKIAKRRRVNLVSRKFIVKYVKHAVCLWYGTETMIRRGTKGGSECWHEGAYRLRPYLSQLLKLALKMKLNPKQKFRDDEIQLWDELVARGPKWLNPKRSTPQPKEKQVCRTAKSSSKLKSSPTTTSLSTQS